LSFEKNKKRNQNSLHFAVPAGGIDSIICIFSCLLTCTFDKIKANVLCDHVIAKSRGLAFEILKDHFEFSKWGVCWQKFFLSNLMEIV